MQFASLAHAFWMVRRTFSAMVLLQCFALLSVINIASAQAVETRLSRTLKVVRIAIDETRTYSGALSMEAFEEFGRRTGLVGCTDSQGAKNGQVAVGRLLTSHSPQAKSEFLKLNRIEDPKAPVSSTVFRPLGTAPTLSKAEEAKVSSPMVTYLQLAGLKQRAHEMDLPSNRSQKRASVTPGDCADVAARLGKTTENILVPDNVQRKKPDRRFVQLEVSDAQRAMLYELNPKLQIQPIRDDEIVIRLSAQVDEAGMGDLPDEKELDDVKVGLARARSRLAVQAKPVLIILDDSWPSNRAFLKARDFFKKALPLAWGRVPFQLRGNLGKELPAALTEISAVPPPSGYGCATLEVCQTHAHRIDESLQPFEAAAAETVDTSPVEVVFVPLNKAQGPAASILLREFWNFAYFAAPGGVLTGRPSAFNELSMKTYLELGSDYEENFLSDQISSDSLSLRTSSAVVYNVIQFARYYSEAAGVPVYVNLSWTTDDQSFQTPVIRDEKTFRVLGVTAAGNDCDPRDGCKGFLDDINAALEPVNRSSMSREYLTVMNLDSTDAPTCKSNRIPPSWFALAYAGRISKDCGTSFASPRVAWLLAAADAVAVPLAPRAWWKRIDAVVGTRESPCDTEKNFGCMRLTASRLFASGAVAVGPIKPKTTSK